MALFLDLNFLLESKMDYPPKTNAVLLTAKLSPLLGRQTGGYFERSTRSSTNQVDWFFHRRVNQQHSYSICYIELESRKENSPSCKSAISLV